MSNRFSGTTDRTVDELVDHHKDYKSWISPVEYILYENYVALLRILKSKENKPSCHDLTIINTLNDIINTKSLNRHKNLKYLYDILVVYKTRKV